MPSHPDRVRANQPEVNQPVPRVSPRIKAAIDRLNRSTDTLSSVRVGNFYSVRVRHCPKCGGPSLSGDLCHGCVYSASTAETPWGV